MSKESKFPQRISRRDKNIAKAVDSLPALIAEGNTPLILTTLENYPELIKRRDELGMTVLMHAAQKGLSDVVLAICALAPEAVNEIDNEGKSIADYAAEGGLIELSEKLKIASNPVQHIQDSALESKSSGKLEEGFPQIAAVAGEVGTEELILTTLKRFPNFAHEKDPEGRTALMNALISNDIKLARKIIAADPKTILDRDTEGRKPLSFLPHGSPIRKEIKGAAKEGFMRLKQAARALKKQPTNPNPKSKESPSLGL